MRRRLLLAAAAIALVATACGYPYIRPGGAPPLRYRDQVFTDVTKTADVVYGSAPNLSGQTVTLYADVYRPVGDTVTRRPAVVWVHGGSFCCGNKTSPEIVDEANTFARQGYVSVSISYRLEPGGCSASTPTQTCIDAIRNATADGQTAVEWLRANAATYGVDPDRIAIAGTSAGAIIALQVGYAGSENPTKRVRGAVSLSGASLLSPIGPGDAPALLFHGTADGLVPYQWAVSTMNAAKAAGLDVFLTVWEGEGHVPYAQHRQEILDQTSNFLYWEMDLPNAAR
jgi:acetyl esterase/lipase